MDIIRALDCWLRKISSCASTLEKIEKQLDRIVLQTKYEGFLTIAQTIEMEQGAQVWKKLLQTLKGETGEETKEELLDILLTLFYLGHISLPLVKDIILKFYFK